MSTIDDLQVKFSADIKDLSGKVDQVSSKFTNLERTIAKTTGKISNQIGLMGRAFTIGAIVGAIKAVGDYQASLDRMGAELVDMSGRANVSIEALQRLRFAADQNGASAEGMSIALTKLNKAMGEARAGSAEMQRVFKSLGLEELVKSGASTDQVLAGLADAFSQVRDPAIKAAIASKLMGKTADEMVPLLSQGAKGLRDMAGAMPDAAVKSSELAHKLDSANDATEKFWGTLDGMASYLEGGFIDAFNYAADQIRDFDKTMTDIVGKTDKPMTNMQRNLLAAIKTNPVKVPEAAKPKVNNGALNNLFGTEAKPGKAFDDSANAAKKYQDVIDDLNFDLAQLGRTEAEAAFQEELRNQIARAGVALSSQEGQAIQKKVESLMKLTAAQQKLNDTKAQWQAIGMQIEDSTAGAFADMVTGAKSANEAIGDLLASMAELIAKQVFLQAIQSATGAMFGDGGLGAALGQALGGFASGGGINPGNPYMVGERGPELFIPKVPGVIVPNNRSGNSSGGLTYAPVINSTGSNTAEIRQMLAKDKQDIMRLMPKIMVDKQRRNALGGAFH